MRNSTHRWLGLVLLAPLIWSVGLWVWWGLLLCVWPSWRHARFVDTTRTIPVVGDMDLGPLLPTRPAPLPALRDIVIRQADILSQGASASAGDSTGGVLAPPQAVPLGPLPGLGEQWSVDLRPLCGSLAQWQSGGEGCDAYTSRLWRQEIPQDLRLFLVSHAVQVVAIAPRAARPTVTILMPQPMPDAPRTVEVPLDWFRLFFRRAPTAASGTPPKCYSRRQAFCP